MSVVHLEVVGSIATLRLDNPSKLNSLTPEMLAGLDGHLDALDRAGDVR